VLTRSAGPASWSALVGGCWARSVVLSCETGLTMCLSKVRYCPMTGRGALEGGNCCTKSRGLTWFYEILRKTTVPAKGHLTCGRSGSRDLASRRRPRTMAELNHMCLLVQTTGQYSFMYLNSSEYELASRVECLRLNSVGLLLGDCNTYQTRRKGAGSELCERSISSNDSQRNGVLNVRIRGPTRAPT